MLALGFGFWEAWELYDKVTFNMFTRIISVNPEVTNIDVKADVYSAWKRWMIVADNNKIGQVIRVIGGDPTTQGQKAGDIYFLVNGWRLQVDLGQTAVVGSLFSDDFDTPLIDFDGNEVFQSLVSSLVTGVDVSAAGGATAQEVWEYVSRTITDARMDNLDASVSSRSSHSVSDVWSAVANDNSDAGTMGNLLWHQKHTKHIIYIDTELIAVGDGSQLTPFNNVTTAIDFAEARGIRELIAYSDLTIDRKIKNFIITGVGVPTIDCNGQDLDKSEFNHCVMTGQYTGQVLMQECNLSGLLTLNGYFEGCAMSGAFEIPNLGTAFIKNSGALVVGVIKPSIDIGGIGGTANLVITGYDGGITILNCDTATCDVKMVVSNGVIELDTTCTDGNIVMDGNVTTIRNDAGSDVTDNTISPQAINLINSNVSYIKDIEGGKWELAGNQMIFYASDNITEISRFNMFDSSGNPTTTGDIYKRERV